LSDFLRKSRFHQVQTPFISELVTRPHLQETQVEGRKTETMFARLTWLRLVWALPSMEVALDSAFTAERLEPTVN
jgi:hypothetical protein